MARLKILVLNAGSSTLKGSLFELTDAGAEGAAPTGLCWTGETDDCEHGLRTLLAEVHDGRHGVLGDLHDIDVVGYRVVHGGASLRESVRVTPLVRAEIARVAEYAPSHNAAAPDVMTATSRLLGDAVPQVAVFDTAFHRTLGPAAFTYAGPHDWLAQGIRRFGFHGISHQYASHRAARLVEHSGEGQRIVTCHLGSGCSLAAVRDGASVDTTMGFTPMDGLPMARRSGAVDPGILIHLLRHGGYTVDSLEHLLIRDSGLAGLSGTDGDMRTVIAAADAGDARAKLALDVFVHHVRQGIASMAASMAGIDALVFTGGVGEHSVRVRADVCASLGFLGVALDARCNANCAGEADLSAPAARVRTFVIPAQENWMIARECMRVLAG